MDKIIVRQGETFRRTLTTDNEGIESLTITVWDENDIILESTAEFLNKEATLDAGIIEQSTGTYEYAYTVVYQDGSIDILPDSSTCSGECEYPEFEICAGIPGGS